MVNTILSWFRGSEEVTAPAYAPREVWSYRHVDPKTRRVTHKPVLVFRKASDGMFWGLLLTATRSKGKMLYVPRLKNGKKVSVLSQMRTLKAGRLVQRLGKAGEKEFSTLSTAIVRVLAETAPVQAPVVLRKAQKRVVLPIHPRYERRMPSPLSSPFSPVYILQPR